MVQDSISCNGSGDKENNRIKKNLNKMQYYHYAGGFSITGFLV